MVFDLVVTGMIGQALAHYGPRVFTFLDAQVQALMKSSQDGDDKATVQVNELMETEILRTPDDAALVARELLELPDPDDAEAPTKRLRNYSAKLNGTFNIVRGLRPSLTALPGWFHTTNCVVVVDARPGPGNAWSAPKASWHDPSVRSDDADDYYFEFYGSNVGFDLGIPRVWVIDCASDEKEHLILRLRERFQDARSTTVPPIGREQLPEHLATIAGVDAAAIRTLTRIYERRVVFGPLVEDESRARRPGETDIEHLVRHTLLPSDATEEMILSPDGVAEMQDALRDLVIAVTEEEMHWR